jgi:FKBP-type peptidyl-prolyl cis-trans isomerase 2
MPEDKMKETDVHKEVLEVNEEHRPGKRKFKLKLIYILAVIVILVALISTVYFLTSGSKTQVNTVVAAGDNVSIYYTGSYQNGTVFSSNMGTGQPISFIVGAGSMIAGIDDGVIGMRVGESKILTIPPNEGYGYINDTLRSFSAPIKQIENLSKQVNNNSNISVGEQFNLHNGFLIRISSLNSTNVTLDYWPLLAGYTLIFNVTVASINQ